MQRQKKPYERYKLQSAYAATLSGMTVYRAARVYQVPESTLRDRTRQNVSIDCHHGANTLFTEDEERKLVDHIVYMADIGYGYSLMDTQYMACRMGPCHVSSEACKGKRTSKPGLGVFFSLQELKVVKPQCLSLSKAESATKENIDKYFQELNSIFTEHDLKPSPQRIFKAGIYDLVKYLLINIKCVKNVLYIYFNID
ncbi:hypothetical protein DPMN_029049 [Dreissena polymorpha]|uniref:HTH psq-type domain-containing protein n=1 Tax=Dreissena polymorpha TaxID=45954 RepID=A0A9D4LXU9_DREPO|nr:hypothetical protein DPMN_029049 [Dreissena polymorpha]